MFLPVDPLSTSLQATYLAGKINRDQRAILQRKVGNRSVFAGVFPPSYRRTMVDFRVTWTPCIGEVRKLCLPGDESVYVFLAFTINSPIHLGLILSDSLISSAVKSTGVMEARRQGTHPSRLSSCAIPLGLCTSCVPPDSKPW